MSDADHQNRSPRDPSGGGSSAPDQTSDVEVADGKNAPVIKPALVYDSKGKVVDLSPETIKAVDDFVVPHGYRREGAREWSFMYSLGIHTVPDRHERRRTGQGGNQGRNHRISTHSLLLTCSYSNTFICAAVVCLSVVFVYEVYH